MLIEICEMAKHVYLTLKYDEKLLSINFIIHLNVEESFSFVYNCLRFLFRQYTSRPIINMPPLIQILF